MTKDKRGENTFYRRKSNHVSLKEKPMFVKIKRKTKIGKKKIFTAI